MRLFAGIEASQKLKNLVVKWQEDYKDLPVRFIKPENLHITLIPPWYGYDPNVSIKLLNDFKFSQFKIIFDKILINFRSQVIWTEPQNIPGEITTLKKRLSELFQTSPDKRKFYPHLTIARFKNNHNLKNVKFRETTWDETVDNIILYESILNPLGVSYRKITVVNLYEN